MPHDEPTAERGRRASGVRLSGSDRRRLVGDRADLDRLLVPEPDTPPGEFDPRSLFANDRPIELEIGCGKGAFLAAMASTYPDVNLIGVELAAPFARAAALRMRRRSFDDVRVMCGDAGRLVRETLRADSVNAVHVFFPDPWPKKRHRKRRIFTASFLDGVARVLVPDGMLCLATDVPDYYASMRELTDADGRFERLTAFEWRSGGITNFERKYLDAGRTSFRATYRKRSVEGSWRRL